MNKETSLTGLGATIKDRCVVPIVIGILFYHYSAKEKSLVSFFVNCKCRCIVPIVLEYFLPLLAYKKFNKFSTSQSTIVSDFNTRTFQQFLKWDISRLGSSEA